MPWRLRLGDIDADNFPDILITNVTGETYIYFNRQLDSNPKARYFLTNETNDYRLEQISSSNN